ncbi:hypothetical protein NEUTE2DRAFT_49828, partial [Neurospora tetrasperma FGSC 2509]
PSYSPNLNPIENLWSLLKDRIAKGFLEISAISRNNKTLDLFIDATTKVWLELDMAVVDKLIDSMPNRI